MARIGKNYHHIAYKLIIQIIVSIYVLQPSCHARSPLHSSVRSLLQRRAISPCASSTSLFDNYHRYPILTLRGGSDEFIDDYDDEYDEDDYDDDEFSDDFDMELDEGDFLEDNTLERIAESWRKTPPFTKMYLSASATATLFGYIANKNEFPNLLSFDWKPTLRNLQLWRPFTAFLNIGPFGLSYLMTGHFVWTYMSTLERLNHDKPYDFWLMIAFGCVSMVVGYSILGLSPRFLGHNLSTFFVYVWSRYHEGLEVNMMELFNTRAETLPWFFLAQTALLEGELPLLDMLGIVFGHIYHHCKTTNVIRTPRAVIDWYKGDSKYSNIIRDKYKVISSDFELQ